MKTLLENWKRHIHESKLGEKLKGLEDTIALIYKNVNKLYTMNHLNNERFTRIENHLKLPVYEIPKDVDPKIFPNPPEDP